MQATLELCKYVNWMEYPDYVMMHRHEKLSEVTLITHGNGQYAINNRIYPVQVGDVILCGSGVVHDAFMQEREHYGTLTIQISGLELPDCEPGQFLARDQVPVFHAPQEFPELNRLMNLIRDHFESELTEDQALCEELLISILEIIQQMTHDIDRPVRVIDSFCLEIEEYINAHYEEDLSLEAVANKFFISTYHLSHLFKKETGYNFKQYLMRMRIGEAQKLLDETEMRVVEIAQKVGYEDSCYFSRAFQKETGMTPKEYRRYVRVMG